MNFSWNYEISTFRDISSWIGAKTPIQLISCDFDSYLLAEDDLHKEAPFRLLEVDNRIRLPINTNIRILVTSADVF